MAKSKKKSFKALIVDKDGLFKKVHLLVADDDTIYQDTHLIHFWVLTILLIITIIGIFFLEILSNNPNRYLKLVSANEIRGIKRVNFKMDPRSDKEYRVIALAIGYDQMIFINAKDDNDLNKFINEKGFEELDNEDYQKVASKYENRIQMFRDTKKYGPLILVLVILVLVVAIATPIIISSLV